MKKRIILSLLLGILVLSGIQNAFAENDSIPPDLRVGVVESCGDDFEIRLAAVPDGVPPG